MSYALNPKTRTATTFVSISAVEDMQAQYSKLKVQYMELEARYNRLLAEGREIGQRVAALSKPDPSLVKELEQARQLAQLTQQQFDLLWAENQELMERNKLLEEKYERLRKKRTKVRIDKGDEE